MSRLFRLLLVAVFSLSAALMFAFGRAPVFHAESSGPSISKLILGPPLKSERASQDDVSQSDAFTRTSATITQRQFRRDHDLTVEMISVGPDGFQPAMLTRPSGRFLLGMNNGSGVEELTFQLMREDGTLIQEARVNRKQPNWRGLVNLPAGPYRLTETRNPEWVCRIVITPRR